MRDEDYQVSADGREVVQAVDSHGSVEPVVVGNGTAEVEMLSFIQPLDDICPLG